MSEDYNFQAIEEKWQKIWEKEEVYKASENPQRTKYYCLEMYPYPSGRIHMGQVRNYSIGDVIARYKFMKGYNVLHPIGWDALGMPAENAAITQEVHPQDWTLANIAHMKKQLKRLGFSYDWSREVNTCLPEYYKWNQWIFLKMLEKGLAYRKKSWVNWCPRCQTVLANEQVIGERCWRCDSEVRQKEMEQWFLKISDYAEELLAGHQELEKWPEHVLIMQKNWIGKSVGAHVSFPLKGSRQSIEVFTTRLDTIYGATFLVLSPEHPLGRQLIADSAHRDKLERWIEKSLAERHLKKDLGEAEKEGIDTGKKAINPFNGQEIPIWIANYVLMEYGTGAIMAVPAHDQRDFDFARKYSLPIKVVIVPEGQPPPSESDKAFEDYGIVVNSGPFSNKSSSQAAEEMVRYATQKKFGRKSVLYRLRDWGISRQRYWGTPIPVVYCQHCGIVPVPYDELPVVLPYEVEFKGEEGSPLSKVKSFVETRCPKCGGKAKRETDTMDTFFDSSWYHFRYTSPQESKLPFNPQKVDYWLPVDLYIGGVEHAILHLIYARFFCKFLRDFGLTKLDEPFPRLLAQGMVTKDGAKMSKSKGNVVDPDDMISKYGADTLRLFILFAAPPEKEFAWNEKGIEGCFRFLNRVWAFYGENLDLFRQEENQTEVERGRNIPSLQLRIKTHQTIKKVSQDIEERFHFNTAISSLMELFNLMKSERDELIKTRLGRQSLREAMEKLVILLSPFAPHFSQELWQKMGHEDFLIKTSWPSYEPQLAQEERLAIVIQINGKLRDKLEAERELNQEEIKERALNLERVQKFIRGKKVRRVIYVKNKLINIVI